MIAGRMTRASAFDAAMAPSLPLYDVRLHIMWRSVSTLLITAMVSASCGGAAPGSRVSRIRQRGVLVCGVFPGIAGFAQVDRQGHYTGFDVDFCRAVAAAIVGSAERIRYQQADRSEEHTSELQSRQYLVCRLL